MRNWRHLGSGVGSYQLVPLFNFVSGSLGGRIPAFQVSRSWNVVFWVGLLLSAVLSGHAQPVAREYEVKATLLFNFCHFVEWPDSAFADAHSPFVIGIMGDDPFGKFIDDLVRQEKTHGRVIQIRRLARLDDPSSVHLLYVGRSEQTRISAVLAQLKGRPILSVGESIASGFARRGGIIEFVTVRDNIKLRINLDESRAARLAVSSKLLHLAELVRTEE